MAVAMSVPLKLFRTVTLFWCDDIWVSLIFFIFSCHIIEEPSTQDLTLATVAVSADESAEGKRG